MKISSKNAAAFRQGILPQIHSPSAVFCSEGGCSNPSEVKMDLNDWAHEHLCLPCAKRKYPNLFRGID